MNIRVIAAALIATASLGFVAAPAMAQEDPAVQSAMNWHIVKCNEGRYDYEAFCTPEALARERARLALVIAEERAAEAARWEYMCHNYGLEFRSRNWQCQQ